MLNSRRSRRKSSNYRVFKTSGQSQWMARLHHWSHWPISSRLTMGKINWKKELNWNEDQLDDLRFMAYAYIRQGKYDIALPIFEALSVIDSDNAYDAQTLGAIYLQLN